MGSDDESSSEHNASVLPPKATCEQTFDDFGCGHYQEVGADLGTLLDSARDRKNVRFVEYAGWFTHGEDAMLGRLDFAALALAAATLSAMSAEATIRDVSINLPAPGEIL